MIKTDRVDGFKPTTSARQQLFLRCSSLPILTAELWKGLYCSNPTRSTLFSSCTSSSRYTVERTFKKESKRKLRSPLEAKAN
jgi:hypothetical protein